MLKAKAAFLSKDNFRLLGAHPAFLCGFPQIVILDYKANASYHW